MPTPALWAALATAATLIAAGAQGLTAGPSGSVLGWSLLLTGATLAIGLLAWRLVENISIMHFTQWLRHRADQGTTSIQNAEVRTPADLARLQELFDDWERTVERVVNRYCWDGDASRIEYLDTFTRRRMGGATPNHAQIREMTAEMVSRMRALLVRVETRETTLRRYVPSLE